MVGRVTRTSKAVGTTGIFSVGYSRSGRQNCCYWRVEQIRGPLGFTGSGPENKARAVALLTA